MEVKKYTCPLCKAKPGYGCTTPGTSHLIKGWHAERVRKKTTRAELSKQRAQQADQIAAEHVAWMLEYLPCHHRPADDPLRTWLVFRLAESKAWQAALENNVLLDRWLDVVHDEVATPAVARRYLRRWIKAFKSSLNQGASQSVMQGMDPMLDRAVYEAALRWADGLPAKFDAALRELAAAY